MPYTLNGVGTRYVGRSNQSVLNGVCPFCNRLATLSHYDTRECFVVLFVPVIPLRKFRIQGDCSSCRKHYRVPWADFQASVATVVNPLREAAARSPRDEAAQVSLVEALVEHRMLKEAEEACRAGLALLPEGPRLNELMGGLLAMRGDHAAALPFRRKSAGLSPKSHPARAALGRTLAVLGQNEEAVRELSEARRLEPSDAATLRLLADTQLALSRWPEALQTYEDLLVRHPELKDKELLRNVRKCKETLGYPLSPEEQKAGRSWWPFGRKRSVPGPVAPGKDTNWKLIWIGMAAVAAVALAGGIAFVVVRVTRVDLYVDNGLKENVTVTLDGKPLGTVVGGPPMKRSIEPGTHRIAARGRSAEIESFDAKVDRPSLADALFRPRFYVYDVRAAHIYRRTTVRYSASPAPNAAPEPETLVAFQRFFSQADADYVFQEAPHTIQMDSHSSSTTREVFHVASDLDYKRLGVLRYREKKPAEAEKALRKAIELAPCEPSPRENLANLLSLTKRGEESLKEVRAWMAACGASVAPHRYYQSELLQEGRRDELLAEYRARLETRKGEGAAHYLYGRLLEDADEAAREYEEAVRLDPQLTWGHFALGHLRLSAERFPEAMAELEAAMKAPDAEPSAVTAYALAAIGAGSDEKALRFVSERTRAHGDDGQLWQARWTLLLAKKRWEAARRELDQREKEDERNPETFARRAQLLRLSGTEGDVETLIAGSCKEKDYAWQCRQVRFEMALEAGRFREAAEAMGPGTDDDIGPLSRLYCVAAMLLSNDRPGAEARARAFLAELQDRKDPESQLMSAYAKALLNGKDGAAMLRAARRRDFETLKDAYFFVGARAAADGDRTAARDAFRRSEGAALDSDFPLLAARRLGGG